MLGENRVSGTGTSETGALRGTETTEETGLEEASTVETTIGRSG